MKFQYLIIVKPQDEFHLNCLNDVGKEGWELVSAFPINNYIKYVFKKSYE